MDLMLRRQWTLGARLDGGGFGQVHIVHAEYDGSEAVAKLIPKDPGADRELLFANLGNARNVVPVLDQGETLDHWVIVMPRADMSLSKYMAELGRPMTIDEALPILVDVATALADLDGQVVHRDLKPANILRLNGTWCIADFGISRYAEATTAPDTRKLSLTPPYAAPEQWRAERATERTDIYALGIIAHELLVGHRPFLGPGRDDFRDQHLHETAPPLNEEVPVSVASLVAECLLKAAAARPTASNVIRRLQNVQGSARSGGLAQLENAHHRQVERMAEEERVSSELRTEEERRNELAQSGHQLFVGISNALRDAILDSAPSVTQESTTGTAGWSIRFGEAFLSLSEATPARTWIREAALDVVLEAEIRLQFRAGRSGYQGRAHTLWFVDATEEDAFGWFETAFMHTPVLSQVTNFEPFALPAGAQAAGAVGSGITEYQVAWPFTRLVPGELEDFISRWASWFAAASDGSYQRPSRMPEHPTEGSWRR